jgi:hypothetical protein
MNRYSQITTSEFNPLSFQEIMAAPLAMRQKHDSLDAQRELLRQGLAKTNPHKKYYEEAIKLKDELNNQINTQAELLAKEGVTPNSQADFLKLNRDYQETMSPTGKLGMINAHNVNLQSTYKNYIDEAIKAGQSPAIAKLHADQAIQKHMKEPLYDERGRVVDFSAGNAAPKYIDNVKWINELASKVGFTQSNWAQASSGISKTADGRFVVNESAKGMTKDNIENLNRLAQAANREVSDPASEIRQNIDYNFKNPQTELDSMLNQLYARRERESGITDRNKSIGSVDWNEQDEINGGNVGGTPGTGVIINNDSTLKSDALNYTTYSDALNARKRLMTSNSPKDRAELADLEELQRNADSKLNKNPAYIKAKNEYDRAVKKLNSNDYPKLGRAAEGEWVIRKAAVNRTLKVMSNIKDAAWKDSSSSRHSYSYLPTNSQEQTNWDIYNKGVFNTLKGGNLANLLDISSIYTTNGSKTNVSNTDVNNIQVLLNGADEKSFTINSIKTYGSNKTPEVTMTFIPNKNAKEYTMDRRLFTDYNDYGGAEKPVTVTFRLKDFSNASKTGSAVGYKSLSGAITDFWKDKGGVNKITNNYQGAEVKDAFVKSEYSKYSNDELNKLRNVDEDANRALQIRYMEYQASKR